MKTLKNLDFFQKISVDNISQPTMIGSLLSLSAISLIAFLLLGEVNNVLTPKIKTDTIVVHDKDQYSKLKVNIAVRFQTLPCHIISVDQEDSIGNHRMDVSDTLIKTRLRKDGSEIGIQLIDNGSSYLELVEKAIRDEEGCKIDGYIEINKVPGNIHISHHKWGDIFMYLRYNRQDLFDKIFFNHRFSVFNFGDNNLNDRILYKFGYNEHTLFNRIDALPDYTQDFYHKSYDYYIKLIPHLFSDKLSGEDLMGYQYSLSSKSRDYSLNSHSHDMPIIMINYDFSPVTMKITRESKNFGHSLTHICAIVGGVFVIFSILNRIFLSLMEFGENKVASS